MNEVRRRILALATFASLAGAGGAFAALTPFALAAEGCSTPKRPDGGKGLLPTGSAAPDFSGTDADGNSAKLSDVRGKIAVVYFYPKDGTPACTKEACGFRDRYADYRNAGIALYGVSHDSEAKHRAFRDENHLPFVLASDEGGAIERAYGVKSLFGLSARVTFLVGPDGVIARVFDDVDPVAHADEVLAAAKMLGDRG